jgi:hypothetical protein
MRLSRALILAVLIAVGVIVPGGYVAASGNDCVVSESVLVDRPVLGGLGRVMDQLADLTLARSAKDENRAIEHAREAGRLLAGLGDTPAISMTFDAVAALFPPGQGDAVARSLFESAGQTMGAVTRQESITDTAYLGLHAKRAWFIQRRSGPLFVDVARAWEKDVRVAEIFAERKFFLRLRIAREFEAGHEAVSRVRDLPLDARAAFLDDKVIALTAR